MFIENKTVYQTKKDDRLTALFKQGVNDYYEFVRLFSQSRKEPKNYEAFVKEYGGYNRGLGYTDYNFKSITVTTRDDSRTIIPEFTIWDDNKVEFYEADIRDWM